MFERYLTESRCTGHDPSQSTLTAFITSSTGDTYGKNHPAQTKFSESLLYNLIVACGLPLSIVEQSAFRTFVNDVNPKLSIPSRQHLTYKMLPQLVEKTRIALKRTLDSAKHVALTVDIWTDRSAHSFLAITAHTFVMFKPLSSLLTITSFTGSHTGARIAEEIDRAITDNNLEGKISYIVTDNASNMKRAMEVLKDMQEDNVDTVADEGTLDDETFWEDIQGQDAVDVQHTIDKQCSVRLACFAHSLQLVIKDGLEKLTAVGVRGMMAKCSKLCSLVHQSAIFHEAFERQFGTGRSLPKPNDTRWNSTFRHLLSIANLDQVALASLLREQNQIHLTLTAKEFAILQELVDILQPFMEATDLTQGDQYPTIGCVVPSVVALDGCLVEMMSKAIHHTALVRVLHESLRSRFSGLFQRLKIIAITDGESVAKQFGDTIYPLASLVDPSYGLLWMEDYPGTAESKQLLKDEIIGMLR